MTQFSFTADYDAYGQAQRQFSLAVPRGRNFREPALTSEPYLGTLAVTEYAQRDDDTRYMVNRVARTSSFEILNDGTQSLLALREAVLAGAADLDPIGLALTYYDGDAFTGLPFTQLGDFGAVSRSENLVLTEDIVQDVSRDDNGNASVPHYLNPAGPIAWTDDYPIPFREQMPTLAGYRFHNGDDGVHQAGYYTEAGQQYDFHVSPGAGRGLPVTSRDPLGRETTMAYDDFEVFPQTVTDPVGLMMTAAYDYRVLQPHMVTDPNGNRTQATFTPLGLLESTVVMGKETETLGDTLVVPGTRFIYDLLAFMEQEQPVSVTTVVREHHVNDTHVPLPERDNTIQTVEFSDGFGRELQTRTQAEDVFFGDATFANDAGLPRDQAEASGPAIGQIADPNNPRVIVSGWQIYDNKGRVVEKFEPFFAANYAYVEPRNNQMGQRVRMFYDPRGQVIRTVNPDGSEQRVIYGVPLSLDTPDQFSATPWEAYTYDANDLAPLSEGPLPGGGIGSLQGRAPVHHHLTPSSIRIDPLGRTVESIQRNRNAPDTPAGPLPPIQELHTSSTYDIRSNLLTVTDALDRIAFRYSYDLANNGLRVESIDAGIIRTVMDALGNPVEQRDSKNALALNAYDELNRPIRLWARDNFAQSVSLRQHLIYADSTESGISREQASQRNLLGQLLEHYDEAGRIQMTANDFKGNLLEKSRQVISDEAILAVFADTAENNWQVDAFQVDWQPLEGMTLVDHAGVSLAPTTYTTTMGYDALGRVAEMRYPEDVDGQRRVLTPSYNRASALQSVSLNSEPFVEHIAYSANGQRTLVAYGNGTMTRYAYDPLTFRLTRLRSERFSETAERSYQPAGVPLQDLGYEYDLIGNITAIHDRTPGSGVPDCSEPLYHRNIYRIIHRMIWHFYDGFTTLSS